MTIWREYKHKCRFKHNIKDAPWLVDRECLIAHEHGFAPNPLCTFFIQVYTEKDIDFKLIKQITTNALATVANKIIEKQIEDKDGHLIQPWYYDFGTMTTETMVDDLKKLILVEFRNLGHDNSRVRLRIEETRKYSIYDDDL